MEHPLLKEYLEHAVPSAEIAYDSKIQPTYSQQQIYQNPIKVQLMVDDPDLQNRTGFGERQKEYPRDSRGKTLCVRRYRMTGWDINNYELWQKNWAEIEAAGINALVYQWEICPKTFRDHLQCYCEIDGNAIEYTKLQKILADSQMWCGRANASQAANLKYCHKEVCRKPNTEAIILGRLSHLRGGQMEIISEMLKNGARAIDIWEEYPAAYLMNRKKIWDLRRDYINMNCPIETKTNTIALIGPGGTGKSMYCWKDNPTLTNINDIYEVCLGTTGLWLTDYDGQSIIIIDELEPGLMKFRDWKMMTDNRNGLFQCKGSDPIRKRWNKVYMTSNYDPDTWFPKSGNPGETDDILSKDHPGYWAVKRRINEIIQCRVPHETVEFKTKFIDGATGIEYKSYNESKIAAMEGTKDTNSKEYLKSVRKQFGAKGNNGTDESRCRDAANIYQDAVKWFREKTPQ